MTGQSGGRRFPRRLGRPSYRPADVDAFIDRIEATLSGTAAPGLNAYAAQLASSRSSPPDAF